MLTADTEIKLKQALYLIMPIVVAGVGVGIYIVWINKKNKKIAVNNKENLS